MESEGSGFSARGLAVQPVDCDESEEMVHVRIDDTTLALPTILIRDAKLPQSSSSNNIKKLFDLSENFHFGHPLESLRKQIADGWYDAYGQTERQQLRDHIRVWYDHFIRRHYVQLLKTLLDSRRKLIEAAASVQEGDNLYEEPIIDKHALRKTKIRKRADRRCRIIISHIKQQVCEQGLSSDDEQLLPPPVIANNKAVVNVVPQAGETTLSSAAVKDLGLHQPLELADVHELLSNLQHVKRFQPDHPSLDFTGLDVEDVIERTGLESVAERVGLMPNRSSRVKGKPITAKNPSTSQP